MPFGPRRTPTPLWLKTAFAAVLVLLADTMLYDAQALGAVGGAWAMILTIAAIVATPALLRDWRASIAAAVVLAMVAVLVEAPGLLGWALFWCALMVAVLSPRARSGDDVRAWLLRLAGAAVQSLLAPISDARRWLASRRGHPRFRPLAVAATLVVPVVGGAIFLGLFALANPVMAMLLERVTLAPLDGPQAAYCLGVFLAVWMVLRPRRLRRPHRVAIARAGRPSRDISPQALVLSFVVFNAVFALQNGLDVAFLWSGAPLPEGVTLADYAHRGAYTLIGVALLAGLFVLVALRPDSVGAGKSLVRALVMIWVAQTLLLVASSALRTLDYVEVYSLTRLRIAALIWMGLVALGLVLICWRVLKARTSSWLINANALAAGLVLCVCSVIDLGAVAAAWNVGHSAEVGGRGAALDVCYLDRLGDSALVSLARLEQRPLPPSLAPRVALVRDGLQQDLRQRQDDWRTWTFRGLRRLDRARLTPPPRPRAWPPGTSCGELAPAPSLTAPPAQ